MAVKYSLDYVIDELRAKLAAAEEQRDEIRQYTKRPMSSPAYRARAAQIDAYKSVLQLLECVEQ